MIWKPLICRLQNIVSITTCLIVVVVKTFKVDAAVAVVHSAVAVSQMWKVISDKFEIIVSKYNT